MNKQFSSAGRRVYNADESGSGSSSSASASASSSSSAAPSEDTEVSDIKKGYSVRPYTATVITAITFKNPTSFDSRFADMIGVTIPAGHEEFFPAFTAISFSQGSGVIDEEV